MGLLRSMKAGKRRLIRNKCVCRKLCFRMFTIMELRRTGFLFLFRRGLSVIRLVYGAYRQFVKDEAGLSCVGRVGHVLHCACKFAG